MTPFLWPVYAYGSGEREDVAVFFDYGAAVSFINDREQHFRFRECYFAEPRYDQRVVSDVLGEQLERDLRFTAELGDAARAARAVAASRSRRVAPSRPSGLPSTIARGAHG